MTIREPRPDGRVGVREQLIEGGSESRTRPRPVE